MAQNRAGWVLIGFGAFFVLVEAANLYVYRLDALGTTALWFFVGETVLDLGLPLTVVYFGYELSTSPMSHEHQWQVVKWAGVGYGVMEAVTVLFFGHLLYQGTALPPSDVIQVHVIAGGGGLLLGTFVGVNHARFNERTAELAAQRDGIRFLNRILRHNVLNSINIIDAYAEGLREEVDGAKHEDIDVIQARSDAIADLINEVRPIAAAFAEEVEAKPVDLSRVLRDELALAESTFEEAEFRGWIPDGVHVRGTEALSTVFDNLLINAVEHNDADTPRVNVSLNDAGDYVVVRVMDNGPGVPDDRKDAVFEPSDRGDRGLGLYLVKTLVEYLGGAVRVTDNEPRGAIFTVVLPRAQPPGEETPDQRPPADLEAE